MQDSRQSMLDIRTSVLSLRSGMALSMLLMLLPLAAAALLGYLILRSMAVEQYQDVAWRQRNLLVPLRDLQLDMLQVEIPLEEYLLTNAEAQLQRFRSQRSDVVTGFERLLSSAEGNTAELITAARQEWQDMDAVFRDLIAARASEDMPALLSAQDRFDALQTSSHDKLQAAADLERTRIEADYRQAERGFERAEWIAGIAATISLLLMAAGIWFFNRTIVHSVSRLVEGAERFANGDREHRIRISVPRELQHVAGEFNRMIGRIQETEAELAEQARRDRLTGLRNRLAYDEAIAEAFSRLQRMRETFSLIAVDIDHFKQINDTHGHDGGDAILSQLAGLLTESVRAMDRVYRLGGEEFSLLLPATDASGARAIAEKLRKVVAAGSFALPDRGLALSISLGVAEADSGDTAQTLGKKADMALYRAKESGRNTVITYQGEHGV